MITASFFKNKRVTVFGLGLNMGGVGTIKFLSQLGVREIIVTDIKSKEELAPSLEKLSAYKNITFVLGQHRPEDFTHVDLVIKNPVIPWSNEYVRLAESHGVPVEMDSSIFFELCPAPIIGVTGSKGKTTTSSLIAHICEHASKQTVKVGIGQVGVLNQLAKINKESLVVFELSSWRLSAFKNIKKSPHIAVLTNIYADHLNYYKTLEGYTHDKKNIFLYQKSKDTLVANFEDQKIREMAQDAPGNLIWFSTKQALEGDAVWFLDNTLFISQGGVVKVLLPANEIPLRGEHNISNVLAAAAAALSIGLSAKQIREGIISFPGIQHRLEFVAEKQGVRYYNDTAATIPDATIAALRTFREPIILIAGGSDKRLDFMELAKAIVEHSKGLVLFKGEGTEKLIAALRQQLPNGENRKFEIVESMAKAVELASRGADTGDVILLSPGAASFGLFKNEFDRGEQFRLCVMSRP